MTMKAWTDYPITELGDTPGMRAPVRECEVTEYDGDKYCRVVVGGHSVEIKAGYLYTQPGRFAEVPQIDVTKLEPAQLATMLAEVEQRVARECAEICGEIASSKVGQHEGPRDTHVYEQGIGAEQCFSAIRARFLTGEESK